ncbi:MAG: hypothetical protein HDT25_08915 [Ruminococcus sp.]|nr:hypothetical protein [Ruminococcus sp.]
MDCNKFSFDALFKNGDFKIHESKKLLSAFRNLNDVLELYVKDCDIRQKIENAALDCTTYAQHGSFKQGFCFAVKTIIFILKQGV